MVARRNAGKWAAAERAAHTMTSIIMSMICAPPMIVRIRDACPGQSTSVNCTLSSESPARTTIPFDAGSPGIGCVVCRTDSLADMCGDSRAEAGEAEVERDSPLLALRMLVERCGGVDGTQRACCKERAGAVA